MPTDETSESPCDGCDHGRARESGREFAGPDEFRDNDVVIWFPNQVFKNRMSRGRRLERDFALSLLFLILLAMRAVARVTQQSFKCVRDS
jgi:hypothetical protein